MRKSILFYFVILIFFFGTIFYCPNLRGVQKTEWKGKIEYKDGVKVIKNPNEPIYREIVFDLEEDLSIGNDEDENYLFYRAMDIEVDKRANIYVLDSGNYRIQKFDQSGNYLLTIGKRGQGPGEFSRPFQIQIDDETGNIYVNDMMRKVMVFDQDGKYLDKDITFGEGLTNFYIDSEKNIFGESFGPSYRALLKIDRVGKVEKRLAEFPFRVNIQVVSSSTVGNKKMSSVVGGTTGYEYDLFLSQINKETFVYGYSKEYELFIINKEGDLLSIVKRDAPSKKITSSLKSRIEFRSRMQASRSGQSVPSNYSHAFPEYMPFFYSIFTDSSGRIWVKTKFEDQDGNKIEGYDIFSQDGYYLYQANLSIRPKRIKNGYLYTFAIDEETGSEKVKRYKIKNWDQIKEGI